MHKLPVNTVVPVNLSVSNANWVRYALGAVLRLNTVVMHCRIIWFTLARPTHFALAVTPSMANYFLFGHGHKAARTRGDVKTLTRLSLAYCDGGSYVSAVSMVAAFIVPAAVWADGSVVTDDCHGLGYSTTINWGVSVITPCYITFCIIAARTRRFTIIYAITYYGPYTGGLFSRVLGAALWAKRDLKGRVSVDCAMFNSGISFPN